MAGNCEKTNNDHGATDTAALACSDNTVRSREPINSVKKNNVDGNEGCAVVRSESCTVRSVTNNESCSVGSPTSNEIFTVRRVTSNDSGNVRKTTNNKGCTVRSVTSNEGCTVRSPTSNKDKTVRSPTNNEGCTNDPGCTSNRSPASKLLTVRPSSAIFATTTTATTTTSLGLICACIGSTASRSRCSSTLSEYGSRSRLDVCSRCGLVCTETGPVNNGVRYGDCETLTTNTAASSRCPSVSGSARALNTHNRESARALNTPDRQSARALSTPDRESARALNTPDRERARALNTPDRQSARALNTPDRESARALNTPDRESARALNTSDRKSAHAPYEYTSFDGSARALNTPERETVHSPYSALDAFDIGFSSREASTSVFESPDKVRSRRLVNSAVSVDEQSGLTVMDKPNSLSLHSSFSDTSLDVHFHTALSTPTAQGFSKASCSLSPASRATANVTTTPNNINAASRGFSMNAANSDDWNTITTISTNTIMDTTNNRNNITTMSSSNVANTANRNTITTITSSNLASTANRNTITTITTNTNTSTRCITNNSRFTDDSGIESGITNFFPSKNFATTNFTSSNFDSTTNLAAPSCSECRSPTCSMKVTSISKKGTPIYSRSCDSTPVRKPRKSSSLKRPGVIRSVGGGGGGGGGEEGGGFDREGRRGSTRRRESEGGEGGGGGGGEREGRRVSNASGLEGKENRSEITALLAGSVKDRRKRSVVFSRSRSLTEKSPSSFAYTSSPLAGSPRNSVSGAAGGGGDGGSVDGAGESHHHFCRVRSFKSTRKGLVRNGESFRSTDTPTGTFMSSGSVRHYRKSPLIGRSESVDSNDSNASVGGSSVAESYYRVGVVGAVKVGKSALVQQFLASEGLNTAVDSDFAFPATVTVLLDTEESLLEFLDLQQANDDANDDDKDDVFNPPLSPGYEDRTPHIVPRATTSIENKPPSSSNINSVPGEIRLHRQLLHCDAYAVIFALNDVNSFKESERWLRHLREELGIDRVIVLVGNKSDLVRQRKVSEKEAFSLAHRYDCKFIETSAELSHNTDELLVGTLRQIRLKLAASQDDAFSDSRSKVTSKKRHKWQRMMHVYKFLQGSVTQSQSMDSCQDFSV